MRWKTASTIAQPQTEHTSWLSEIILTVLKSHSRMAGSKAVTKANDWAAVLGRKKVCRRAIKGVADGLAEGERRGLTAGYERGWNEAIARAQREVAQQLAFTREQVADKQVLEHSWKLSSNRSAACWNACANWKPPKPKSTPVSNGRRNRQRRQNA
jgi:flagellar biosynthesis/type III secretory pathway protein FliH